MHSTIELTGLVLEVDLGTYAPGAVVPDAHFLDLTLTIDPSLVLIQNDSMERIFDYDPLIERIETIARDGRYETQEWLITRIARACARYDVIQEAKIAVSKSPVSGQSGRLGVSLSLDRSELDSLLA